MFVYQFLEMGVPSAARCTQCAITFAFLHKERLFIFGRSFLVKAIVHAAMLKVPNGIGHTASTSAQSARSFMLRVLH